MPALIVFGARNLGRTIAKHFAGEGWGAAGFATSEDTIERFCAEIPGAIGFRGDARRGDEVEAAIAGTRHQLGSLDLIVNAITARPRGAFGGGRLAEAPADALEPYVEELLPCIFNVLRFGARAMADSGGTIVQITGGSSRRAMPGGGPWAAAAFASKALVQSCAQELREGGVHVALLVVDAIIASEKTAEWLGDKPADATTSQEDVARAVAYLQAQTPRGWTHELQITPRLDRWVP